MMVPAQRFNILIIEVGEFGILQCNRDEFCRSLSDETIQHGENIILRKETNDECSILMMIVVFYKAFINEI